MSNEVFFYFNIVLLPIGLIGFCVLSYALLTFDSIAARRFTPFTVILAALYVLGIVGLFISPFRESDVWWRPIINLALVLLLDCFAWYAALFYLGKIK